MENTIYDILFLVVDVCFAISFIRLSNVTEKDGLYKLIARTKDVIILLLLLIALVLVRR